MTDNDPIVPVAIPPLIVILKHSEEEKGSPLTEDEVLRIRDSAVCLDMPLSMKLAAAESRGYDDLDLEHAWEQWQEVRVQIFGD